MDDARLLDIVETLGRPSLVVLGDLILDAYTWGHATRVSQEGPVLVLKADRQEFRLGGAANVAHMAARLGADVTCAGVVGADESGKQLLGLLAEAGINSHLTLVDASRPTSFKERFLGRAGSSHASQVLRVDREVLDPLAHDLQQQLRERLAEPLARCQALLIADYAKGVCSPELLRWAIDRTRAAGGLVLVDPGPGRSLDLYRRATLIKPNRRETETATGLPIPDHAAAIAAGQHLCARYDFDLACITLDADGMVLSQPRGSGSAFPTQARAVYDITGAGDMVLAMLGYCLAQHVPLAPAVQLANVAAGLEVEHNGVVPIPLESIRQKLLSNVGARETKIVRSAELPALAARYRERHQRIVFTNGCFDLLHVGHVTYLQEAASLGEILIVGVNSDDGVRRLKGPQRPVIGQADRAAMLAALQCVSHVVIFDEDTPHALLHAIRPDVLVKGGTYRPEEVVGHEVVSSYGGRVTVTSAIEGVSTSRIIESMQKQSGLRRAG
jgi:D-beta-D-heptose 7-phosphate kinase/D-beta-D-heptose 1-phosphate adenosyltransferase